MKSVITGVAGFIGSHLAEKLLQLGHEVVGVDKFLDNYPQPFKENNLSGLRGHERCKFIDRDVMGLDLHQLLDGVTIFSTLRASRGCGQVGVRSLPGTRKTTSWPPRCCTKPPKPRSSENSSTPLPLRYTVTQAICPCAKMG